MSQKFLIALVALMVIGSMFVGCVDIDNTPETTPTLTTPNGFVPVERTFIYDINSNGSALCTWANTIIPKKSSLQYTYHFYGGEAQDFVASDSLGQELNVGVNEVGGEYTITLLLVGYEQNVPYQFNLSFRWDGLVTRSDDWHTFYSSVNVDEPQAAKIVVIPPPGATISLSTVTHGYLTETFDLSVVGDRPVLTWQTPYTGNKTEMFIRANYRYNPTPTSTPTPTLTGFIPVERTSIYDISGSGSRSTLCTWANTIIPKKSSLLYTYHFYGGEAQEFAASDSLGQGLDVGVNLVGDEYTITTLLVGYEQNVPYQFNLSFRWYGLITRSDEQDILYTNVNVDEPQAAKIVVILPPGATIFGPPTITHGNLTEPFELSVAGNRTVLTWQTPYTGNETQVTIRANYRTPTVTPS